MTLDRWHFMINSREDGPDTLIAEFEIRPDSPWFAGHFPDQPILPGVAILVMATEAIQSFAGRRQQKVRIAGLKRVRFKLPIKPHDPVTVEISRDGAEAAVTYIFEVRVRKEIACTGVMLTEQTGAV